MAHSINNLLCTSCQKCLKSCPQNAISEHDRSFLVIDEALCMDCGECINICPENAIMALTRAV